MSYALIILNCERYADKRQKQCDGWLADPAFPIPLWFHVIGDPTLAVEFALDESAHLLQVQCKDDYMSLPKKTYLAIQAIRTQFPEVQTILKTDDDMNCLPTGLHTILGLVSQYDYGGYIIDHRGGMSDYHFQYVVDPEERQRKIVRRCRYANGRFYFLSRRAADHLLSQRPLFWDSTFEDNTVGFAVATLAGLKMHRLHVDHQVFTDYDYVPPNHTVARYTSLATAAVTAKR